MRQRSNLVGHLEWLEDSADYYLHFQVVDKTGPLAEVATFKTDDPELQDKLRIMSQAYRMGQRHPG